MRLVYSIRPDANDSPDEAAATWFALLLSDDATDADQRLVEEWRAASPENDLAWSKIATIWDYSESEAEEPAILRMREAALARPAPRRAWVPMALAASLALVFVGAGLYSGGVIPGRTTTDAPSQIALETRDFRTAVGQQQKVALSDGSNMVVNTASAVQVAFSGTERKVRLLDGEAYFRVARDPQRPFVVDVSGVSVTATGTQFSVRKEGSEIDVLLSEGHVRVQRTTGGKAEEVTLEPGSLLRATASGFIVTPADTQRLTNWTTGQLSFNQTPLSQAVNELNRYSPRKISLADPSLGSMPVTGLFATNRPDELVAMLTASGLVTAQRQSDGSTVLKPAR